MVLAITATSAGHRSSLATLLFTRRSTSTTAPAFNWLNHPLPQFSSGNQLTLKETLDGTNPGAGFQVSPSQVSNFGVLDTKAGAPNQRIWELSLKYMF